MNSIVVCNTGTDSLSRIFLNDYTLKKITLNLGEKPIGPQGIVRYNNGVITANNYSDSISFFSGEKLEELKNVKVGAKPNDLVVYNNKVYTICGESNSVVVVDIVEDKIIYDLRTGNWPYSIEVDKRQKNIYIANLESNNISIISIENNCLLKQIEAKEYPTKVKLSNDGKYIFVCESYLGEDRSGYLEVISTTSYKSIKRIEVGSSPIDLYEDEEQIYVSNFTDGSISLIDKKKWKAVQSIYIGGMPKGIIKKNNILYVADYLKGKLYIIEQNNIKKVIALDSEPNAMTLF